MSRTKFPSACSGAGSSAGDPAGGGELVGELFGGEATELDGLPSGEPDFVLDISAILRLALLQLSHLSKHLQWRMRKKKEEKK